MKKIITVLILLIVILASCNAEKGNISETETATNNTKVGQTENSSGAIETEGWFYNLDDVKINLLEALPDNVPKYLNSYTIPSCASQGTDYVYVYDDIEITCYSNGGVELPYIIYLKEDGNGKTSEGVGIGDTVEQVVNVYGSDYVEKNSEYNYVKGETTLSFLIRDGKVLEITYQAEVKL